MDQLILYIGASLFILVLTLYIAKSVFEINKTLKYQSDQNKLLALIAEKLEVDKDKIEKIIPKASDFPTLQKEQEIDDL